MPDQRAAQSRSEEFDALYRKHSREVWALIYGRRLDADLAMDITQEAFLRLWRQLESGETIQNPLGWLLRVARNLAEDYSKSAFRRYGTQSSEQMNALGSEQQQPLDKLVQDETFENIRTILAELPVAEREILTLRYALDYDSSEIARVLGINVSAVYMRLSRARQQLGERLLAQGVQQAP